MAVKKTTTKAKLPMMRRHLQSSFQEIAQAASYKSGGRKIIKISSGSICRDGVPGIKPMISPARINKIG
jgi:hypothetical protein